MQYGVILRKTRKDINLSQEEMAEELFFTASKISKLETGKQTLYMTDLMQWMHIVKRVDISFALVSGLTVDQVMKHLFSEEYLKKVSECALFQNSNGVTAADDVEKNTFDLTEEVQEWLKYLNELIREEN